MKWNHPLNLGLSAWVPPAPGEVQTPCLFNITVHVRTVQSEACFELGTGRRVNELETQTVSNMVEAMALDSREPDRWAMTESQVEAVSHCESRQHREPEAQSDIDHAIVPIAECRSARPRRRSTGRSRGSDCKGC